MSELKDLEGLTPETDPMNTSPRTERGLPVRMHSMDGRIMYAKNQGDRDILIMIDRNKLELRELINAPWWKQLWWRIKPEL